jgi:hypothetical protein
MGEGVFADERFLRLMKLRGGRVPAGASFIKVAS